MWRGDPLAYKVRAHRLWNGGYRLLVPRELWMTLFGKKLKTLAAAFNPRTGILTIREGNSIKPSWSKNRKYVRVEFDIVDGMDKRPVRQFVVRLNLTTTAIEVPWGTEE